MSENLSAALQITLIGMSFVLAALALLAVVMAALVRLTADPPAPRPAEPVTTPAPAPAMSTKQRAVAVAVAVAQALEQPRPPASPRTARDRPAPLPASAWQATMRARNLKQREQRR